MNIVLTGATGLIGSALIGSLHAAGHRVTRLVRSRPTGNAEVYWNPERRELDSSEIEGTDTVIHLAGETIAARWTERKKARIRQSRIESTRLLVERFGRLTSTPAVFICASAIGYYGDRGEELLREDSAPGSGFLADLCREWESAAMAAEQWGIRTVRLRFGVVLSAAGGALKQMLPAFRMGVGGKLGSGNQFTSWVCIQDVVGIILHVLNTPALHGPVNTVAPNPVRNREFTRALGEVLGRPTFFSMPAFAVRLAFGEMGQELLLASTRVEPVKLKATGYAFRYPEVGAALRDLIG